MPILAHVDMDCFFCACEIKRRPELKGKTVIIAFPGKRGVVSTASYEARKYNVFSASPVSKARENCPQGIFIEPDFSYYEIESKSVINVLRAIDKNLEQISIDEATLDITTLCAHFDSLEDAGKFIQKLVDQKTGLPCSIGVARLSIIAKMASDYKKPEGVTVVNNVRDFLLPLPIEKFPGIGKITKQYYHINKVNTIGDLARMSRFKALEKFGMQAVRIQQIVHGENISGLNIHVRSHSVSREHTFSEDVSDIKTLSLYLESLCKNVYKDLDRYAYRTVSIKVRYSDFRTITKSSTLSTSHKSLATIIAKSNQLLESVDLIAAIRLIGIKLSNLVYYNCIQTTLGMFS